MKKFKLLIKNLMFLMNNDLDKRQKFAKGGLVDRAKFDDNETILSLHTLRTIMKRNRPPVAPIIPVTKEELGG